MRIIAPLLALALAALAAGCNSSGTGSSSLSDLNASLGTNFGREANPYGQRRPDVNYQFTRPTTPTIANR